MRRHLVPLLVVLLAFALVAPAALAQSTDGDDDATDLTLYATEEAFTLVTREGEVFEGEDEGEEEFAPNVGDRFLSTDALYLDEERGEQVGRNHIECTVTEAVGDFPETEPTEGEELPDFRLSFVCTGVVDVFDVGTLSWTGLLTFSSDDLEQEPGTEPLVTVAVTGGTGDYIGASGEVDIFEEPTDDEDESLSRYEVTLLN